MKDLGNTSKGKHSKRKGFQSKGGMSSKKRQKSDSLDYNEEFGTPRRGEVGGVPLNDDLDSGGIY